MKFTSLKHRVARAEALVEGRRRQTVENADALLQHWKQTWTPWRIIAVGLGLGFLTGQTRPTRALGAVGATRWLKLAGSASSIFATLQATLAAWQADQAAEQAEDATDDAPAGDDAPPADATATTTPSDDADVADELEARHRVAVHAAGMATADGGHHQGTMGTSPYRRAPDGRSETESWAAQPPRPAEAATDVSER